MIVLVSSADPTWTRTVVKPRTWNLWLVAHPGGGKAILRTCYVPDRRCDSWHRRDRAYREAWVLQGLARGTQQTGDESFAAELNPR